MAQRQQFRVSSTLRDRARSARWRLEKPVAVLVREVVTDYADGQDWDRPAVEFADVDVQATIDKDVLVRARARAAQEGVSLGTVVRVGLEKIVTDSEL